MVAAEEDRHPAALRHRVGVVVQRAGSSRRLAEIAGSARRARRHGDLDRLDLVHRAAVADPVAELARARAARPAVLSACGPISVPRDAAPSSSADAEDADVAAVQGRRAAGPP